MIRLQSKLQRAIGFALLALSLYAAFSVIENAGWVRGLPPLIIPIVTALLLGVLTAGRKRVIGYPLILAAGVAISLGLGLPFLEGGAQTVFGIFFLAAAWSVSHITLRLADSARPLLIPLPGLLVVFISLAFLDGSYFFHLPLFAVAAVAAVAFFQMQTNPGLNRRIFLPATLALGLVLSLAAVAFSWPAPTPSAPIRPAAVEALEEPVLKLLESSSGYFKNIPSRKNWLRFDLQTDLPFTSPVELGETVVMRVSSPEAHRWRVRVFETYTPNGWIRIPNPPRAPEAGPTFAPAPDPGARREEVSIGVRLFSSNTHVATAGAPIRSSASALVESSPQPAFNLSLEQPPSFYIPSDIAQFREALVDDHSRVVGGLEDALSVQGLALISIPAADGAQSENRLLVHRLDAESYPTTALVFPRRQNPPASYTTTGSVSTATPNQLRNASRGFGEGGIVYPNWVTDRYLQLPVDFPQQVKDLAQFLAEDYDNAYDVAINIQDHLGALKYGETVIPPPPGVDPVEWFLTAERVGFCTYFASAMITMLRSLDIPARLVVGFAPGEWDEDRDAWIVRSSDYHAWPEVYFSEYGWVEFEPTPAGVQPNLQNLGAQVASASSASDLFIDECLGELECEEFLDPVGATEELDLEELEVGFIDPIQPPTSGESPLQFLQRPYVLWPAAGVGAALLILLAVNLYMRFLTHRLGLPVFAFAALSFFAGLAGTPRLESETPSEFGARLGARMPRYAPLVETVVAAYERALYARLKQLDSDAHDTLSRSWRSLRWPIIRLTLQRFFFLRHA